MNAVSLTTKRPSTMAERIEHMLETRQLTHEQASKQCGFKHRTEVSSYLVRLRRDPEYYRKMSLEMLEKLAKGLRVSLFWLVWGEGDPDVSATPKLLRYPNLVAAVKAERSRWQQHTIASAATVHVGHDLSKAEWVEVLDDLERIIVDYGDLVKK